MLENIAVSLSALCKSCAKDRALFVWVDLYHSFMRAAAAKMRDSNSSYESTFHF
jgi:hypothetical protein